MARAEVITDNFDLFPTQPVQSSILKTYKLPVFPVTALAHGSPFEFYVPRVPKRFINLGKTELYLKTKIVNATGGDNAATVDVGVINDPFHSAFSSVEVELGGKRITDPNGLYFMQSMLQSLLSTDEEVGKTQKAKQLFVKDTAGKHDEFVGLAAGTNEGLKARASKYNTSQTVELMDRLRFNLAHQHRALIDNVDLRVRLYPNHDNVILVTPAPTGGNLQVAYQFMITEAVLYVHCIEVSDEFELGFTQALQRANARYPVRHPVTKTLTIPGGQTQSLLENLFIGKTPNLVAIALVSDANIAGGYQTNPFFFNNYRVNQISLNVNGRVVPNRPYQPDFTTKQYIREYNALFECTGTLNTDRTVNITRDEYGNGYTIFLFDLTQDEDNPNSLSPPQSGTVRCDIRFDTAPTAAVKVIVYAEFEEMIEIDRDGNVLTSF